MNWSTFYRDFAAAYGTCWLIMLGLAIITVSRINAGAFGAFGFPIIALIYAYVQMNKSKPVIEDEEARWVKSRIAERVRLEEESRKA